MDDQTIQHRLDELEQATVKSGNLYYSNGVVSDELVARFDELRRRIKYLRFDVEATRRERDFLQRALEGDGRR